MYITFSSLQPKVLKVSNRVNQIKHHPRNLEIPAKKVTRKIARKTVKKEEVNIIKKLEDYHAKYVFTYSKIKPSRITTEARIRSI